MIDRPFNAEEFQAFEKGFLHALNAPVNQSRLLFLLMELNSPLPALEVAGMMVGGRFRVLGGVE